MSGQVPGFFFFGAEKGHDKMKQGWQFRNRLWNFMGEASKF
jgi:hypothetical protein